jgi:signal transduction histidine kinase
VRRRLVIAIAAVAAGAVLLLAVPLGVVLRRDYRNEELLRLQRDTIAATRSIDLSPQRSDPVELPRSRDPLSVYDRSARLVAGARAASPTALVHRALVTGRPQDATGHGQFEVVVPLLSNERVMGAVRAVRRQDAAVRDTTDAWLALAGVAMAIILTAVAAAVVLARRLALPLERLATAAGRLGDGDFSARAALSGIPEVDAAATALNTTATRLDDVISRERAFSADASHQLRTPLQALRIELEAIELRPGAPPELPAALGQVDRLQATVETLLAVARDTSGADTRSDLDDVLDTVRGRWHGRLAADGRPLRIIDEAAGSTVRGSSAVLVEVIDVLLDNALRHGAGAVTVRARPIDAYISIDVGDEGPGFPIAPDEAFERRTRGPNGQGHGIGLALARSLAHAEGGRLVVARSGPGPLISLLVRRTGDAEA